jgi:hypothetical protein
MRFGNRNGTALATVLVLLISSIVSIQGDGQTVKGPEKLGDHYPIRITSIDDDTSQIIPEVDGSTRWVYHLCHPGASFINVHFAEFGKYSFWYHAGWLISIPYSLSNALFDSFSFHRPRWNLQW